MAPKDKYTDPELRDEVKEEIHQGDKGGKPGQWSARKAQMMASEYKKRGGDYNTSKEEGQSESQKHLDNWTKEDWQTKEGEGTARQDDDSRKRYLPKKAWEELSEDEKNKTDEKKVEESKEGKQFVGNTGEAKQARRKASVKSDDEEDEKGEDPKKNDTDGKKGDGDDGDKDDEAADEKEDEEGEDEEQEGQGKKSTEAKKDSSKGETNGESAKGSKNSGGEGEGAGTKRSAKQDTSPNKKQKDSSRMQSLRKRD
ncbi:uncharacterized protein MYU51_008535 [Penicillium brevicompactum]